MSNMFEPSMISTIELANRFVRSATWEGMASEEDGTVTSQLIDTMVALADGEVGLIISGHAYIRPEGKAGPRQLGVYKDDLIEGLKEMTSAVHQHGGKIVMQLAHAGRFAAQKLTGLPRMVVSDAEGTSSLPKQEMTPADIQDLVTAFADAARRAKSAGFDGVQIHAAHGYLLSQFLSPASNQRQDEYGGDVGNRVRVLGEAYRAIREVVGDAYPVLIKINCRDFADDGLSLDDSLYAARMLAEEGLDAVEVSGGLLTGGKLSPSRVGINSEEKEAYFREEARAFREQIDIPLILVGGMRSMEVAEHLINDGVTDYISLSRALIREPGLIKRWKSGDLRRALCKSDNLCFKPALEGRGIYCLTEEREKQKRKD